MADQRRQGGKDALTPVLGPADLQSSVLQCSLDEDYAGFNVQGWNEFCVLQTIDAYRSEDPVPALATNLQQASSATGKHAVQLGTPVDTPLDKGCGVLRERANDPGRAEPWTVLISRLPAGGFDPLDVDGTRSSCSPPKQVYDVPQNKIELMYDPAALDAEHSWVTVERTEPIITLDLGCAGLLCDLPTTGIVMPHT